MDTLVSGVSQNFGQAFKHLLSAGGAPLWLALLMPLTLAALPVAIIRRAEWTPRARIARGLLAALPAFWVAIWVITTAFGYNDRLARFDLGAIVFWVFAGLTAAMALSGIAATVLIGGWHRLTALALLVINLWIIATCAFVGVIVVAGVTP